MRKGRLFKSTFLAVSRASLTRFSRLFRIRIYVISLRNSKPKIRTKMKKEDCLKAVSWPSRLPASLLFASHCESLLSLAKASFGNRPQIFNGKQKISNLSVACFLFLGYLCTFNTTFTWTICQKQHISFLI